MRDIRLFGEDLGHEVVLKALIKRVAQEANIACETFKISEGSVRGGKGKMLTQLEEYLRDMKRSRVSLPNLLVIAIDANCKGYGEKRREIEGVTSKYVECAERTVCAIPDPHVERWLLLDSAAFRNALGRGCNAPDHKCARDRYKALLRQEIRSAGVSPLLDGFEYADDIIGAMELQKVSDRDESFGKFVSDLHAQFQRWNEEAHVNG